MGDLHGAALAGSELAKLRGEPVAGPAAGARRAGVRAAHEAVRAMVNTGAARSAHDIAEGGIAVALAECCIAGDIGATVTLPDGLDPFAEAPGRAFIVSGAEEALRGLAIIGRVGGSALELEGVLSVEVSRLAQARAGVWPASCSRSGSSTPPAGPNAPRSGNAAWPPSARC